MQEDAALAETLSAERPIAHAREQLTAFVGRTLRGPVDTPVVIQSFADFQQTFGGLWQPSPLSYAVEHFFEQGGRQAVIVRVANAATPATLALRCEHESLVLEARAPGTREFLRASVDYDQLDPADPLRFNLVVQRVRAPGSERIEEQEIFRGVSTDPGSINYVAMALLQSKLARVRHPVPAQRPLPTLMPGTQLPVGYVSANPDGHDGKPLSDYDIIGSATRRTGLHALTDVENLAFVYIPPLSRTTEVGASTVLVAAKFCREHQALLILDPPQAWDAPSAVLNGLKDLNFYSDSALMFYPRIVGVDRLRGHNEVFGNGGAVAGVLSRVDDAVALGSTRYEPEPLLRAGAKLAREVSAPDRARLATAGINVLQSVRSAERDRPVLRTLACGASASADWAYLAPRRFALYVIRAIERATRWVTGMPIDAGVQQRITWRVSEFLEGLRTAGAFAAAPEHEAFAVVCDERINGEHQEPGTFHLLVQLAALHAGEYHSFMITHSTGGSRVRPVSINRLEPSFRLASDLASEITLTVR